MTNRCWIDVRRELHSRETAMVRMMSKGIVLQVKLNNESRSNRGLIFDDIIAATFVS